MPPDMKTAAFNLFSMAKKPTFLNKRFGARAVKEQDMLVNAVIGLSEVQKTTFKAFADHANYLALDRPSVAYPAKEMCMAFA